MVARAWGSWARIQSRVSGANGVRTPPGTAQAWWIRRPPSRSITCCPNWRRPMPPRASSGSAAISPKMLRRAGSLDQPSNQSGLLR